MAFRRRMVISYEGPLRLDTIPASGPVLRAGQLGVACCQRTVTWKAPDRERG